MNRLAGSGSLYLRQHAENPVQWWEWGEAAFAEARATNRLIFLSIGYSSCHWCHVMAHESFEDPETAAWMNRWFVNIKVDREERPDIDALYMEAVQQMSGQGGWPLSVWLTPDLSPVYGGTYFPKQAHPHRIDFHTVSERLQDLWLNETAKLTERGAALREALQEDLAARLPATDPGETLLADAVNRLRRQYDYRLGGFGPAPKFPSLMALGFLLKSGDAEARVMAAHAVRAMIRGGIHDQVGGGLHRYSTDDRWLVPHFEKMLYDQAGWIETNARLFASTGDPLFAEALTLAGDFLDREMRLPEGGYGSALDADNDGSEGGFYTYTSAELLAFPAVASEPWEDRRILVRTGDTGLSPTDRAALMDIRATRVRPAFDPKRLTAWNAWALSAFWTAWEMTGDPIWEQRALDMHRYLLTHWDGDRVLHSDSGGIGYVNDYALMVLALTDTARFTGDREALTLAETIATRMVERFHDAETGAFRYAEPAPDLLARRSDLFDNAEPSGHGSALAALTRLERLTGEGRWAALAGGGLRVVGSVLADHALSFGFTLQAAAERLAPPRELVVHADDGAFAAAHRADPDPLRLWVRGELLGRTGNGIPTAWACERFVCHRPVHTRSDLESVWNHA